MSIFVIRMFDVGYFILEKFIVINFWDIVLKVKLMILLWYGVLYEIIDFVFCLMNFLKVVGFVRCGVRGIDLVFGFILVCICLRIGDCFLVICE